MSLNKPQQIRKVWVVNTSKVMSVRGIIPPDWQYVTTEVIEATEGEITVRVRKVTP